MLGLGGLLLLGGRAADLLGRRRVLIGALAVFTLASLAGGLIDDGTLLIAARFLKGAAAAFTVPAALSLITTTFTEGPTRNKALAIFNAFGASGFSFGLVFGGLLTSADWRLTFLLPVPVRRAAARRDPALHREGPPVLGAEAALRPPGRRAPDRRDAAARPHARRGAQRGWDAPATLRVRVVATGRLRRGRAPDGAAAGAPGHPANGPLVRANLGAMALFGAYVGFQFVATLYLQNTLGWSALETALAFLPGGLLVAFGAPRMGDADQPLRHVAADPRLHRRLRDRLRAVPACRRHARTGLRSCRRCCSSASASRSASRR